jgi:hypothetical protein
LNDQHKKQTSCQILLLGTNLGSLPLSLRWDISPVNVTLKCHAKRKSCRLQNFRRTCWSLFDNLDEMSLSLKDKQWIPLFMQKFWCMWHVKKWKRPEALIDNWMLYHNNGPCHTSLAIHNFLMMNQIPITPSHCIHQISLCATSGSYWPQDWP